MIFNFNNNNSINLDASDILDFLGIEALRVVKTFTYDSAEDFFLSTVFVNCISYKLILWHVGTYANKNTYRSLKDDT